MLVATTGAVSVAAAAGPPSPTRLTVGDQVRPLNVEGAPLFGWKARSVQGNDVQTGYEIRVTDAVGGRLGWDRARWRHRGSRMSPEQLRRAAHTHRGAIAWEAR